MRRLIHLMLVQVQRLVLVPVPVQLVLVQVPVLVPAQQLAQRQKPVLLQVPDANGMAKLPDVLVVLALQQMQDERVVLALQQMQDDLRMAKAHVPDVQQMPELQRKPDVRSETLKE